MTLDRSSGRHLDIRTVLDYLELRLDPAGRAAVEEHLGRACRACRDRVRELGSMVELMRLDRVPEVSASLRARALKAFTSRPVAPERIRSVARRATLVFDSWQQPMPAAVRRAVGETRRLRFALGPHVLELEFEIESAETLALRGRLHASDPSLHRVEVVVGRERLSARPDAIGAFALDHVPLGRAHVTVIGPNDRYRIPALG